MVEEKLIEYFTTQSLEIEVVIQNILVKSFCQSFIAHFQLFDAIIFTNKFFYKLVILIL